MKNSDIKFIILFFGLIIAINLVGGFILKKKFQNITSGFYGKINESIKSDSEIFILGSSRAKHHYNPLIISSSTGFTTYNTGLGGYGLFLNYAILNERIKNNKPKIVILDLSPNTMIKGANSYSKLDKLLPYYENYSSFKEVIHLNSEFSKLEILSSLYIYNSTFYELAITFFKKDKIDNGFIALNGKIDRRKFNSIELENYENFDNNKINYLNKIIDLCINNKILLFGIVSPTYLKFDKNNRIIDEFKLIFHKKGNYNFYDYSNYSKLYKKEKYFKDQLHMNNFGADLFSKEIVDKITLN